MTSMLATCAASAGSGTLLGGLIVGLTGTLGSWHPDRLDLRVRQAGYLGGVVGLVALVFDWILR